MAITKSWHIQINDTNYFLELREKDDFYVLSNLEDPTYLLKIPTQDLFLLTKDLLNIANSNKSSIKSKSTVESFTEQEKKVYQELKLWRYKLAKEQKLAPFMIMTNLSLAHLSKLKELNRNSFLSVPGLGKIKLETYYEEIKNIFDSIVNQHTF